MGFTNITDITCTIIKDSKERTDITKFNRQNDTTNILYMSMYVISHHRNYCHLPTRVDSLYALGCDAYTGRFFLERSRLRILGTDRGLIRLSKIYLPASLFNICHILLHQKYFNWNLCSSEVLLSLLQQVLIYKFYFEKTIFTKTVKKRIFFYKNGYVLIARAGNFNSGSETTKRPRYIRTRNIDYRIVSAAGTFWKPDEN